uniref:Uncharacterized protein n=1 Tax=Podarcis muralis TaxID=64176 RepID=A0A670HUK7_PODMU
MFSHLSVKLSVCLLICSALGQICNEGSSSCVFNISRAATQVGHQLAMIGDECNRMYTGKWEDSLLHLAKGIAANVFHTCIWSNFRSIMKAFGSFLSSGWRKKILDCNWILWVPLNCVCQKWWPAALLAILMWGLVTYGLQD